MSTDLDQQARTARSDVPAAPYAAPPAAVLARLNTSAAGLAEDEAAARLQHYGANQLRRGRARGPLVRFLLQFHNVLIYILLVAAVVTALLAQWVDMGVILAVVLVNALVGFIQEGKAEKTLDAIRHMLSLKATVVRAGRQRTLPAEGLVPGDIVLLQAGDRVPADARLVSAKNLRIDEASLTGESVPVEKAVAPAPADSALGDRLCMAYSGTLVTFGQATAVVVATGDRTEIGRISELLSEVRRVDTPLLRRIRVFGWWLSGAILLLAVGTFLIGVGVRGYSANEMFLAAVGLAVAAIPEGLPAVMTITLAIGVQRMARRNAIVRLLPAVEALGSVTTICTDKTGTLTRNEMTVQALVTREQVFQVSGIGYEPRGQLLRDGLAIDITDHPALEELLRGGMLCNDARVEEENDGWTIQGDPTEAALVVVARKAGLNPELEHERRPRRDMIPFESAQRFMATLHHDHAGHAFVYLKGAPERVLELCSLERLEGRDRPIHRAYWHEQVDRLAGEGRRVLAVAFKPHALSDHELDMRDVALGFTLLGLQGMVDPPREEAIAAIAMCQAAGIRVKMLTGDHAVTARAVARLIGLADTRVVTGSELQTLDDAALAAVAEEVDVYARVSPEHKLRLVEALQTRGGVVAVTGDGVNDAPALKRADVGIAMGITGTEAAKEAAEMVLADDNFASIANAVREGRTIYDNLRKTILFMLPTNGGEAFTLVLAILFGIAALPILPVQILWVNTITAVTLSLALAFEPTEPGTMRRPPRDPASAIVSPYFIWRTASVSAFIVAGTLGMFLWERGQGASLEVARTASVNTLVLFEAFYLLSARYLIDTAWPHRAWRENPYVVLAILLVVIFQLLFTYAPFMQALFQSSPLDAPAWLRIVLVAGSLYLFVELEKWAVRTLRIRKA